MFGNRDIPVYLFTGFLESGKTTCIKEILQEGNFEDGLKTLLLLTEEGEIGLSDVLLMDNRVQPVVVEEEEDLTEDYCNRLVKKYKPDRIVIEVNGMWNMQTLLNETLPENWTVVQTFTTVNAQTFDVYVNNMKSLMMEHFKMSDLVIFNRCDQSMNRPSMRRNVKAINRGTQVIFENADGTVESNIEEELPYDVKEQVDINIKYDGYIKRQMRQVEQFKKLENKRIPENINYDEIQSLRLEAKQKLNQIRPSSIGQASRISGVSPADVSVLLVYLSSK